MLTRGRFMYPMEPYVSHRDDKQAQGLSSDTFISGHLPWLADSLVDRNRRVYAVSGWCGLSVDGTLAKPRARGKFVTHDQVYTSRISTECQTALRFV